MRNAFACLGLLFVALWGLQSCKTADGRPTKLGKAYHNLTGRYNAYYNAELRLTKSFDAMNKSHRDNYNKLLPLYPYVVADAGGSKGPLDEAIKKCVMNIELHRVSNWADDSYFLLGQVEFLKKEYEKSTNTFKYIFDKYNPEKSKSAMTAEELEALRKQNAAKAKGKKKRPAKKPAPPKKRKPSKKKKKKPTTSKTAPKGSTATKGSTTTTSKPSPNPNPNPSPDPEKDPEAEKPDRYGLKHRPVRFDAMLWLAKSYIQQKDYDNAGLYLRQLEQDGKTPYRLRPEVQAVTAHMYIAQEEYAKAIEPLTKAVETTKRKKRKGRYAYVLAQLHQMANDNDKAMEYFRLVLRCRPVYDMEFNARLNMAKNAAKSQNATINPELALRRMLRDGKNEEYKDQIYFALAEVQLRQGNKKDGIASLQKSIAANASGPQRLEASILLGDLFYDEENFVQAYCYYDTSVTLGMDKTDNRFDRVQSRRRDLEPVALNLQAMELQDSLLRISMMAFADQKELAQRLRKEAQDRAKAAKAPSANGNTPPARTGNPIIDARNATAAGGKTANPNNQLQDNNGNVVTGGPTNANVANQSTFPIYNPALARKGEKDFEKRFGKRPLTDNWRCSAKNRNAITAAESGAEETVAPMTEQEAKDFLKQMGVPMSEAEQVAVADKIATAMFKAGAGFRESMRRNDKALEMFDKLLQRFPDTKHQLETWYFMYHIYRERNNQEKANYYKDLILKKHGNSDVAKALQDPSFANAKAQKAKSLNDYYDQTYKLVRTGQIQDAYSRIKAVAEQFGNDHAFKARFAFLEAMCIGATKGEAEYVKALKDISTGFPNTEEDKKAKEMVAILTKNNPNASNPTTNGTGGGNTAEAAKFDANPSAQHYILIVFDRAKSADYLSFVNAFNTENFASANPKLSATPMQLDREVNAIVVRKFNNAQDAMKYRKQASEDPKFLGNTPPVFKMYAIGAENYRKILTDNNFRSAYIPFFEQNYK